MAVCEHTLCTCEPAEGRQFCSDWCQANPEAGECHCHHPGCKAPHSHEH